MKVFTEEDSFDDKVNYVDENDRFVGYDLMNNCCESFGHAITSDTETQEDLYGPVNIIKGADLEPYRFVDEEPVKKEPDEDYEVGGIVFFRIEAEGLPDLYVAIWNYHNGYYSHGFTSFKNTEEEYL